MKVLLLGQPSAEVENALARCGDTFVWRQAKLTASEVAELGCDFIISYRHLYLLRSDILDLFPGRAINLHSSLLPWNRGADPNFWSFLEGSPKGVSIHQIDPGVDTGGIFAQKEVNFGSASTLRTTYEILQKEMLELLTQTWPGIRAGVTVAAPQQGQGSFHRAKDIEPHKFLLAEKGWDTSTAMIENYGRQMRNENK